MNADVLGKWREIAEQTAWKDFAARNAECERLLKLARGRIGCEPARPGSTPSSPPKRRRRACSARCRRSLDRINAVLIALSAIAAGARRLRPDLGSRRRAISSRSRATGRTSSRSSCWSARRSVGRLDPGAARPCRHRRARAHPVARRRPRPAAVRRSRLARLLHVLLLEMLDAAARGAARTARSANSRLGPAAVDSLRLMAVGMSLLVRAARCCRCCRPARVRPRRAMSTLHDRAALWRRDARSPCSPASRSPSRSARSRPSS